MKERLPNVPLKPEQREHIKTREGYLVLGLEPGSNAYHGYVEHSFSMGWSDSYVNFFGMVWSDGKVNAEEHAKETRLLRPDWVIEVFDWRDENLPIKLDVEAWLDALAHNPNTLSGVDDKFKARNIPFNMKE